jgi:hypothetical protein
MQGLSAPRSLCSTQKENDRFFFYPQKVKWTHQNATPVVQKPVIEEIIH